MPCGLCMETDWCIAEMLIVQIGWNADHKPCNQCQMLMCVNSKAGCLRKHIHMQRERDDSRLQRHAHTAVNLSLFSFCSVSRFSSRRRLYEENTQSRRLASSLLKQSPRLDARRVSPSLHLTVNYTFHIPGRHVLRFNKYIFVCCLVKRSFDDSW